MSVRDQGGRVPAQLHLRDGEVTVYSRTGLDWTEQFGTIAEATKHLKAPSQLRDSGVKAHDRRIHGRRHVPARAQVGQRIGDGEDPPELIRREVVASRPHMQDR